MERIELHSVLPNIFLARGEMASDVWRTEVTFERGKSYLIEAESGSGKSSLCSFLYGRRGDYSGDILFDGEDIRRYSVERWSELRRGSIGALFQELRLFGELTAMENVELKSRLTGMQSRRTILEWFEAMGIADKVDARTDRLSYGQQQRVALIRALCQPLDFLLLDEPISHLDSRNSDIMRDIIVGETSRQGAAVIVTSIGKHLDLNYDKVLHL